MSRTECWVSFSGTRWIVTTEGVVLLTYATREEAVDAGVAYAKANAPSELYIRNESGAIEDRRSFEEGSLPPPS